MALQPEHRQEEWYQQMINAATGKYLPSITTQDAGKVLTVESDGGWGVEDIPQELPNVTSSDNGSILGVSNGEWETVGLQIETTYSELKALRDSGELVAGATYRMTDYVTKINGKYDLSQFGATGYIHYAKSAEHPFDLILYAIDGSHLSEIVKVAKHEGDTYFEHSAVEAWDVKYTLDNDPLKYSWADETSGKGVIYYMRDEFNNEAGYDFKNAMFLAYGLKMSIEADADTFCRANSGKRYGSTYGVFKALTDYMSSGEYSSPYDFSHHDFVAGANILGVIQFEEVNDTYLSTFDAEWYYTFDINPSGDHYDYSLNTIDYPDNSAKCIENKIQICQDALASYLSNVIIPSGLGCTIFENDMTSLCCGNLVSATSTFNIFGGQNIGNTIEEAAYSNVIGTGSNYNVIELGSYRNMIAFDCYHNTIRSNSRHVVLYQYCNYNVIMTNADEVVFASGCSYNTVGSASTSVTFGTNCHHNSLGNQPSGTVFSVGCIGNTIGDNAYDIIFGQGSTFNVIGNYCNWLSVQFSSIGAHVCDHVSGEYNDHYPIESRTGNCEVWYGYNSSGQIVSWIPADLVPANNN